MDEHIPAKRVATRKSRLRYLTASAMVSLLAFSPLGCSSNGGDGPSSQDSSSPRSNDELRAAEIERRRSARREAPARIPERVPAPTVDGGTGEVPVALLSNMKGDLAATLSADTTEIAVVSAASVTWNDGALGCPQPAAFYTQGTEPGYHVVLEIAGRRYNYHAKVDGYFLRCDVQSMPPPRSAPVR